MELDDTIKAAVIGGLFAIVAAIIAAWVQRVRRPLILGGILLSVWLVVGGISLLLLRSPEEAPRPTSVELLRECIESQLNEEAPGEEDDCDQIELAGEALDDQGHAVEQVRFVVLIRDQTWIATGEGAFRLAGDRVTRFSPDQGIGEILRLKDAGGGVMYRTDDGGWFIVLGDEAQSTPHEPREVDGSEELAGEETAG